MPNTLGQRIGLAIETVIMNHAMLFLLIFLLCVVAADFYYRFWRVNRDTDHVDLMKEYSNLQLRRKYKL